MNNNKSARPTRYAIGVLLSLRPGLVCMVAAYFAWSGSERDRALELSALAGGGGLLFVRALVVRRFS